MKKQLTSRRIHFTVMALGLAWPLNQALGADSLAPNLIQQGSQNLLSGQPLIDIPVIRGKGGNLRAQVDMVSAGLTESPLQYGDVALFASNSPFPNASQPGSKQTFTAPFAYRIRAYGKDYPASFPAPVLALKPGSRLDLTITDQLSDNIGVASDSLYETNFHGHGFHVNPLSMGDNVYPSINDAPNSGDPETMRVRIPLPDNQEPGLNWYHVHHHQQTHAQVYGGLAGLVTVGDPLDPWPQYRQGGAKALKQRYLTLSEVNIQKTNQAGTVALPEEKDRLLIYGNTAGTTQELTNPQQNWQKRVNGQLNPVIQFRPGETQVWNLASIGAQGAFNIAITDGQLQNPWPGTLLVLDGNGSFIKPLGMSLNADPTRMQDRDANTLIMPGNRLTLALTAPATPGTYYLIDGWGGNNDFSTDNNGNPLYFILATLEVSGKPVKSPPPVFTATGPDYSLFNAPPDKRRTFEFSISTDKPNSNPSGFLINGQPFGEATMPQLQIGTVEEWTLKNVTTQLDGRTFQANHPFHIHQGNFIVTEVNGAAVDPNSASPTNSLNYISPRDTLNIPIGGSVKIKFKVEDYPGKYVFHCHILKHEDQGMMSPVVAFGPQNGLRSAFGSALPGASGILDVIDGVGTLINTRYPFGRDFTGGIVSADALGAAKFYSNYAAGMASQGFDVAVFGGPEQNRLSRFKAFTNDPARSGKGVSVALADISGDGQPEVIVGSRRSGAAEIRIFTPRGALLHKYEGFMAGDFPTGINVAAGDVNADNFDDIIIGAGAGHDPEVIALSGRAIATQQPLETLFHFTAGGGAQAGARVAVGYVAPGTRPSYLANVITTPETGPEAGTVEVWNPYGILAMHSGMVMDSAHLPTALERMARYTPFAGKTDSLQISTGYLGTPGIPQVFAWSTPGQVAATALSEASEPQTRVLYLPH